MLPKLSAASQHHLFGLEVFYEDLEYLARSESNSKTPSPEALLHAASTIKKLCDERDKLWFSLMKVLGTDLIQIPANFLPKEEITDDAEIIVEDLREVADMGAKETPVVRFAYENLCWSTYFDTWESGWDIVEKVDRANFGIVLDTFNIAGRVYADPSSVDGKTANAEKALKESPEEIGKD
ncbi:hypothetical protein DID88_008989 [Monilinia fructigena]|uniref:Xylose isomerase-like TIM barrel domain-containing protein n=1 Tax=Monilinia fructigena TaxID=38457 RepID=A0A395IFY4_9HELO|nr:hypothetical protein DID88_008989 [Monilinia fructigena]